MKIDNNRIICREFNENGKKVVVVTVVKKESQKNDKKLTNIYQNIGRYDYEFK